MTALPTGQRGRLLAMGVTLLALAALWLGVAAPLIDWHAEEAERLDQRRTLAARMAALAASVPQLARQAAQARAANPAGPSGASLLDGATDAVAAAALQQMVQDMAGHAGAALTSAETMPATPSGAYRRIGLHVSVTAPWHVLMDLLAAIEQAMPSMLIDDLQLHATRNVAQPPDPPLDAQFTVLAFRAQQPAPAQAARP